MTELSIRKGICNFPLYHQMATYMTQINTNFASYLLGNMFSKLNEKKLLCGPGDTGTTAASPLEICSHHRPLTDWSGYLASAPPSGNNQRSILVTMVIGQTTALATTPDAIIETPPFKGNI